VTSRRQGANAAAILRAAQEVVAQERWIAEHGRTVAGYVERYGDTRAPAEGWPAEGGRHGDGGQAIYAADAQALRQYRQRLRELVADQAEYDEAMAAARTVEANMRALNQLP
jgi:hypothetical protein